jgi:DNA-binding response OmpR family regulator
MLKVLIAEDDLMIADMVEEILILHGYEVCGIARTVTEAIALGRRYKPDLAIIDLRLADARLGTEIVPQLNGPDRPGILYATANEDKVVLSAADGDACLVKPYHFSDLLRALQIVSEIVATGTTGAPLPRGLHVLPHATLVYTSAIHA